MEAIRALPLLPAVGAVTERRSGKRDAEAFRRALAGEDGKAGDEPAGQGEPALRRRLQASAADSRKDGGTAHHVDVIA